MSIASLWRPLSDNRCQCRLCSHFCIIEDNARGLCGVRVNQDGQLHSLVADRIASVSMDPVEKKPLYHFHPGTRTFSFGAPGCNMTCKFCQNHDLSQTPREQGHIGGRQTTPQELVQAALRNEASSISYTYSEPTIFFELMHNTATLAVEHDLKNIMVSNGFQSQECLKELGPLIHAANIDLKAFTDDFYQRLCGAKLQPVLDNLKRMRELGWWLEVTTLVIPGENDSPDELAQIAGFIAKELGMDTPWHVSRFHPQYRLADHPSTPILSLEAAMQAAKEAGLRYAYIGNVPGHESDNTFCPTCHAKVINRVGFSIGIDGLHQGQCTHCGTNLAGIWK